MKKYSRYAIYYAPQSGSALAEFGAAWLGWDAEAGNTTAHPDIGDLPMQISELTATPRKYGFHGTLKPPFKLAKGRNFEHLDIALTEFARQCSGFEIPQIRLHALGSFLAITPSSESAELAALAQACVTEFEAFRAPLTDVELARRRKANLTPIQERYLIEWGYPYVFDEFHFHLTLSGRIPPAEMPIMLAQLGRALETPLAAPLPVRDICLFGEAEDGNFHIIKRYPLSA